jgi:arabinogalactan endo-1,4-beta-galactosidase
MRVLAPLTFIATLFASGCTGSDLRLGGRAPATLPSYLLGADISSIQEETLPLTDTDGNTKSIFELLKNHGFNAIRLRTFVDPTAPYGYDSSENGCPGRPEAFGDQGHVLAYAAEARSRGFALLLDFHYSDTWADGNSQIIPLSFRDATSVEELATLLYNYTHNFVRAAIAAHARPDIIQIGNGITSGLLLHVPNSNTDCSGNNVDKAPVFGSADNWDDLGTLLRAATRAVREADPTIQVMLHAGTTTDREGTLAWVQAAQDQAVDFDIFGISCFSALHGPPSKWQATFDELSQTYPQLQLMIAEYNGERTATNQLIHDLKGGLGAFFWEPTLSGDFGKAMFTPEEATLRANATDFAEFDLIRDNFGL